ncbi:transcriptional regulator, XRE family [Beutenbergia cavernae DSM 12333]|uniref:Transcriptional regulator, XRE family n=1 Tax=Beutenbergia cavernae (strain ATCC BAA-8 / DSM 12333 / CCUG 43141 / JCM 11478 / NBRC 16432 / NCIMB 13614 / HKI 0122) TaxID=471853 RepID=C5C3N4_BEUC1|nr:helix-turn-helix transcriptional regulator [Beutenbergia cavernae]ACQ81943.1 transcriptional regulator, XRE family [Beutenbergia cavernae DSM 12333]
MATTDDGARVRAIGTAPTVGSAWRHAIGRLLRRRREQLGLRLVDVAVRAGVSAQYLSEVERGRKEPSSEVLAAVTTALGLTLVDLAHGLGRALEPRRLTSVPGGVRVVELSGVDPRRAAPPTSSGGARATRSGDAVLLAA